METSIVVLEHLHKKFGAVTAVEDFSLQIEPGEFITLLGPSGCGKTTVLRMIAGQETPDRGTVQIDGSEMTFAPPNHRPVNMVFQSYALFPHMNVAENIAFGPNLRKTPKDVIERDVREMLALMRLEGYEDRRVNQLSGGQCQRVALARALINRPKVLLLDEPLGALDLKLRKQMQIELKSLNRKIHTTFIYVTHDQEEALTMSDRVVVMNQGKIVQVGSAREIYEKPNSMFVSSFVGETNLLKGSLVERAGGSAVIALGGFKVSIADPGDVLPGQEVHLSIRPEAIDFDVPDDDAGNCVAAEVLSVTFLGSLMRYELALPGGIHLSANSATTEAARVHGAGDSVCVRLPADKLVILKA